MPVSEGGKGRPVRCLKPRERIRYSLDSQNTSEYIQYRGVTPCGLQWDAFRQSPGMRLLEIGFDLKAFQELFDPKVLSIDHRTTGKT